MAISLEMNSKGLVLSLQKKKKRKENCGLLFTSPIKHETFQAVVGQQRPRTKKCDARAVVVLLKAIVIVHGLFCRHCTCLSSLPFEGPPITSV